MQFSQQDKPTEASTADAPMDASVAKNLGLDGPGHRHWYSRRIVVAMLVVLAGAIAFFGKALTPADLEFETTAARRGDLIVAVTATGTLEPINQVQVGSEISGIIEIVYVDFNDAVQAGNVLAHLNTDQLEAKVRQSKAALQAAEAAVEEAQATLEETRAKAARITALHERQLTSQQDLEIARAAEARSAAALASARAQVEVRRAALQADGTTLDKAAIRAPIGGVVISRNVEAGQTVAASFQTPVLFTLAEDLTRMELHLDIDEADIGRVREGQVASFAVDAFAERRFPGTITSVRVAPRTVQGVVTYEALLSVANPDLLLRPGMTATAEITTDQRHDVLLAPNAALRFTPPRANSDVATNGHSSDQPRRVWTLRDGEPTQIPVSVDASDGRWTEVTSGELEVGQPLLVDLAKPQE
jgi:HlyD family secretion protein